MSATTPPIVRGETAEDYPAIRAVNEAAFGGSEEADLIEALRTEGAVLRSLVAESNDGVVGHILFSRMWIDTTTAPVAAVALAPVAIAPRLQRQGIGSALIRQGLGELRSMRERIVIVVGHPEYYPRFGFSSARASGIEQPFGPDVFMALELTPGALDGVRGRVRYAAAFRL
jgi:putative acetyltransferase